jgi:hypothetical protein
MASGSEYTLHIEDQSNPAIPKNCATRNSGYVLEHLSETLDDDLLLPDQFVHHQTEGPAVVLGHNENGILRTPGSGLNAKSLIEPHNRE